MDLFETKALPRAVDYPGMVRNLFIKELGGIDGQRMHATIGIAGECAELIPAYLLADEENFIEESGDAFFYFQALLNMTGYTIGELYALGAIADPIVQEAEMHFLTYCSGELLDQAKKCWVYGKPYDADKFKQAMANWIIAFQAFLRWNSPLVNGSPITLDDCMAANQYKLVTGPTARYKGGNYSDAAAIARADKVAEECGDQTCAPCISGQPGVCSNQ